MIGLVLLAEDLLAPVGALLIALRFAFSRRRKVLLGLKDELRERLGGGPAEPSAGPVVWLHCASAGEVGAAAPLIEKLAARPSRPSVVVTTMTASGRERARSLRGVSRAALAPLDGWPFFHRFARRLSPRVLILVETELWPHMIARCGAPAVLVNARLSDRSFPRYRLAKPLLRPFLRRLEVVCAQSERDAQRFRTLGARAEAVRAPGNLKYDVPVAEASLDEARRVLSVLGWDGKPLLVAGSTHPGPEEAAVLAAFREARAEFPDLRLVLAPRHVERAREAVELLRRAGLRPSAWSCLGSSDAGADAVVLDRLGGLKSFYPLALLSFVGGTLAPIGGHSVLEPALAGSLVCFGPNVQNTLEPARVLESAGAGLCVEDSARLAAALKEALRDPARAREQGRLARELAEGLRGAADRTLTELSDVLSAAGI